MKIAMLGTRGIPARYGGFEKCVEEISTRLVLRGHEVTVYCRSVDRHSQPLEYRGVRLVQLPTFTRRFMGAPLNSLLVTLHSVRSDADVLHYFGCGHVPFTLLGRLCRRGVVLTVDGLEWRRIGYSMATRAYLRSFAELAMVFPNRTVADSLTSQIWYKERTGTAPSYIPYGTDTSSEIDESMLRRWDLEKEKYILFTGRLVSEKGVHTLIEAFNSTNTDLDLVIVGGAPEGTRYLNDLKNMAGRNTRFLGYVYGKEFETIMNAALLYVHPSLLEGTSIALLRAMGSGKCIIASDLQENVDVLGESGLYFKRGDAADLKGNIEALLSDRDEMRKLGESAYKRAGDMFSWDRAVDNYESIYQDTISKTSRE